MTQGGCWRLQEVARGYPVLNIDEAPARSKPSLPTLSLLATTCLQKVVHPAAAVSRACKDTAGWRQRRDTDWALVGRGAGGRWNLWCVACFRDGSEAWEGGGMGGCGDGVRKCQEEWTDTNGRWTRMMAVRSMGCDWRWRKQDEADLHRMCATPVHPATQPYHCPLTPHRCPLLARRGL